MKIEIEIPDETVQLLKRISQYALAGAALGAGTYLTCGGFGIAGLGKALGINLGRQMLAGACVSGVCKSLYEMGRIGEGS